MPLPCVMVGEGRSEGDGQVGGAHVVPLQGAIVVCYGGVRGGVDVVPLEGPIVAYYGSVPV